MSNYSSSLLIQERPFVVLPSLCELLGSESEAIFLQQVYWFTLQASQDDNREQDFYDGAWWVHKSVGEWNAVFKHWSTRKVQRVIENLETKGVLRAEFLGQGGSGRKKSLTVNQNHLTKALDLLRQYGVVDLAKLAESLSSKEESLSGENPERHLPESDLGDAFAESVIAGDEENPDSSDLERLLTTGSAQDLFAILRAHYQPELRPPDLSNKMWRNELREKMKSRGRPQFREDCIAYFTTPDKYAKERMFDVATFCREPADRWYAASSAKAAPAAADAPTPGDLASESAARMAALDPKAKEREQ